MMSILLAALLAFGGGTPPAAAFEADGVRIDGALVTRAALEVLDGAAGLLLVSRSTVEPLSGEIALGVDGLTLTLAPGVRVVRTAEGYVLSVHGRKRVAVTLGGERQVLLAPLTVKPAAGGWDLGSGLVRRGQELAAAPQQDDVDSNLNRLNKSSEKIQKSMQPPPKQDPANPPGVQPPPARPTPPAPQPAAKQQANPERSGPRLPFNFVRGPLARPGSRPPNYFYFFGTFNPFVSAQAVSSEAIKGGAVVSPIGSTGSPSPSPSPSPGPIGIKISSPF